MKNYPAFFLSMVLGLSFSFNSQARKKEKITNNDIKSVKELELMFKKDLNNKELKNLKTSSFQLKQKAVPTLIKVMKSDEYPEKNRWVATFSLGRIMGKKSSAFISKFTEHPSWVMRLASLKTLLALGESRYKGLYAKMLKDKSLIVKTQALENIRKLGLKELAPSVWAMLYDKKNYSGLKGKKKRTNIIKEAIKTIGDLRFEKAKDSLLKMAQKDRYKDVFSEIDYSLSKITGQDSPQGDSSKKKYFWSRIALSEAKI